MLREQPSHTIPVERGDIVVTQVILLDDASESGDTNASLDDAARTERDYVRRRLRQELGHEPTDEEVDEWLRQHTEGY